MILQISRLLRQLNLVAKGELSKSRKRPRNAAERKEKLWPDSLVQELRRCYDRYKNLEESAIFNYNIKLIFN